MRRFSSAAVAALTLCLATSGCKGKKTTPTPPASDAGAATTPTPTPTPGDTTTATPTPTPTPTPTGATAVKGLKTVAAFAAIADPAARSKALFTEAAVVFQHPRCTNCHPAGDGPTQGDTGQLHEPPVVRGPGGKGVVGMRCDTCHTEGNVELGDRSVPGAPLWHLAPASMAWVGQDAAAICAQLKDPARNGQRDLAAIIEHSGHDPLVAWGWDPGSGRTPAPGDQATFAALVKAWVDTGAHCPPPAPKPAAAQPVKQPDGNASGNNSESPPGGMTPSQKAEHLAAQGVFKQHLNAGRKAIKAGDFDAGLALYRKALAKNPRNASVLGELGYAALKQGNLDTAKDFTQRALTYARQDKQRGALLFNLAQIAVKAGDKAAAVAHLEASLAARAHDGVAAQLEALKKDGVTPKAKAPPTFKDAAAVKAYIVAKIIAYAADDGGDDPQCTEESIDYKATTKTQSGGGAIKAAMLISTAAQCGLVAMGGYETLWIALRDSSQWHLVGPIYETENSGCCGAYRDFSGKLVGFRELSPAGQGPEVVIETTFVDQDSDMGIDNIFHSSDATTRVCGAGADGAHWCSEYVTRHADYDGSLETFFDHDGKPTCHALTFDGEGSVTRTPAPCEDHEMMPRGKPHTLSVP